MSLEAATMAELIMKQSDLLDQREKEIENLKEEIEKLKYIMAETGKALLRKV